MMNKEISRKNLRVGVVGAGYLGQFHAEKYARMENVDLVGVADIDRQRADKVAGLFETKAYYRHTDLLDKVDAVSIVAPTPLHFPIGRDFLQNNVDVLIEKPITTTLADADELIKIAAENGAIIQVGHLERFNPAVLALQDIITKPMFIESHRLSQFKDRGIDVSVVHDLMIHDIDIILNFVKAEIELIHAAGTTVITPHVDIANARLQFAGGCVANITASRISLKNQRKIRLFQRDAYISVDFANNEITVIRRNMENESGVIPGMEIKSLNFAKSDALDDELKSFVAAVTKRTTPAVTGRMGRDALKIALSIMDQINS